MGEKKDNAYFTPTISGNLKFVGDDFTTSHSQSVKTQFILSILEKGITLAQLTFRKTDCTTDLNHRILEVKPNIKNPYSKLTDKLNEEYNLLHLGIDKKSLTVKVLPTIETYVRGDNTITTFTALSATQNSANPTTDREVLQYQFCAHPPTQNVSCYFWAYFEQGDYAGIYVGTSPYTQNGIYKLNRTDGQYALAISFINTSESRYARISLIDMTAQEAIDTTDLLAPTPLTGDVISPHNIVDYHNAILLPQINEAFYLNCWVVYGRYILRAPHEGFANFINAEENRKNITGDNSVYWKGYVGIAQISTRVGNSGQYRTEDDKWYLPPDDNNEWLPLYRDSWAKHVSLWTRNGLSLTINNITYINRITYNDITNYCAYSIVRDFYPIGDAIKAVVSKIDDRVVFEPDEAHSKFLFASKNPVSREKQGLLYITQKSNILKLGYDYPAWLAPITLGKIFTLLKNAFNCRWDIYRDENTGLYHLRIEHLLFYMNGGSYSSSQRTTLDLTSIHDTANHLPISFNTSHWNYQSGSGGTSQATSYEYGWMDTQSKLFDGEKITIPQDLQIFEKESVEERKVDWFDSDIDFCIGVPSQISSDGFAIVMESTSNAGYVWRDRYTDKYIGQNYILSFTYLQKTFGLYGLYSDSVSIGEDTLYLVPKVGRLRTSDIRFRVPKGTEVKPEMNIKTEVGEGEISNLKLDFTSDTYEATVLYQTEN